MLTQQEFNYTYPVSCGFDQDRAFIFLMEWIYNKTHRGHDEFDSSDYMTIYLDSFLTLTDIIKS